MTSIIKVNEIQDAGGNTILSSNGTGTFTSNLPNNTPAFKAKNASDQTIPNTTFTKVTLGTEVFDTNNAFASDRFTVPSGHDGKYFISAQISIACTDDHRQVEGYIYKNGSGLAELSVRNFFNGDLLNDGEQTLSINGILDLVAGDYLELYGRPYDSSSTGTITYPSGRCVFQGYKIIE